ncbi:metallophosphoesterase [Candidatus Uabimicrobium sp. HlEnr_7]|uniref:metallophosphoesterase family protein n=1 Tax=Candidatus Uabimicrobium helgolandensis TaxID=3095367 RepID=UPI0035571472
MKLLLFSDLHSNNIAARSLVDMAGNVDIVIGAGDFCNAHRGLNNILNTLKNISVPMIFVPGNNETNNALRQECKGFENVYVLHGNGCEVQNVEFFGVGGGIPMTPFGPWSFDFDEIQAQELFRQCPRNAVIISHSPPKGIVDVSSRGKSLGSSTVRSVIEEKNPQLLVCGHIHGSEGQIEQFENSYIINAGPHGIFWDLGSNCVVATN